jgi:two-component system response regulator RegX3
MQARVLIIEDEVEIAELIKVYLMKDGINSDISDSGESGLENLSQNTYDLIILDLNLPGIDGFEFLHQAREISKIPIVIVSSRDSDEDMVLGLGIGADDFIPKPFSPKILVARVRAHLRRSLKYQKDGREIITFGDFKLDVDGYYCEKGGERLQFPPKEFAVLLLLVQNAGKVMTPEQIYEEVWGNRYGDITTVAVHIQRIRKKIETDPSHPEFIKTIHGVGYMFSEMVLSRGKG